MKDFLLGVLILVLLAALGWLVWTVWGTQLSQLPAQLSTLVDRVLLGISGSLASFGTGLRDSFRIPGL